ncbi:rhodopsin-like [Hydra vulgaris]|uniref:rhodopsin-like n=1 Tax=Hydra vulgaris TaxID=6087 RepID=UPI001F5E52AA|nr:rhodopsin-like [Hydra vulgaris]
MSKALESTYICLLLIFTLTMNVLLLTFLKKRYSYINISILFNASISVCEILQVTLGYVPDLLAQLDFIKVTVSGNGSWVCIGSSLLTFIFAVVVLMHFLVLSVSRIVAIKYPVFYVATFSKKKLSIILLILCYIYGIIWPVFPLFKWSKYAKDIDEKRCSLDWRLEQKNSFSYIICVILFAFILPFVTIFILLFCKKYATIVNQSSPSRRRHSSIEYQKKIKGLEKKYFNMCAASTILYTLAWSPYAVVGFLSVFNIIIPPMVSTSAALFAKLSALINPFVNVWFNLEFRNFIFNLKSIRFFKINLCIKVDPQESMTSSKVQCTNV